MLVLVALAIMGGRVQTAGGGGGAGLHHKDVLEDVGEGRGRLSEGLKSLSSPLVALGKLTNIPKPPSMKWVSQPLLGT